MRPLLAMGGVELRRFLRDRSNIFFVFIFPLLLVLVIGSQFGGDGPDGRVAMAGPPGELRRALAERLEAADVSVSFTGAGDVRERVARGRVEVGLFVPEAVQQRFAGGEPVEIEMIAGTGAAVPAAVQRVHTAVRAVEADRRQLAALTARGLSAPDAAAALEAAEETVARPELRVVDVDEISREFAGVTGFDVGAAGEMLLFVFLASLAGSATLIQARRLRVLARTLAAPVTAGQAIGGQALGRFTIAMFQGGYIMVATALLFGVDWGNIVLALLILAAFAAVAAGAAMVIGSLVDNEGAAAGVGIGVGLVAAALGGCMMPLEFFPDRLRTIAHITPHAWAYEALAEVQRHGAGIGDILPELAVLVAMAAGALLVGAAALRRSLARAI